MHRIHRTNQIAAVLVVLLLVTFFFARFAFHVPKKDVADQSTFGKAFSLVLTDYDGKPVHLYEFRRKAVIAYSWASWCPYCGQELKNLASLKQTFGDNLQVVAVNRGEPLVVAKPYTDQLQLPGSLLLLLDPTDSFFKEIGGYAMPETVFINSRGEIIYHQRGPIKMQQVQEKIKEMLN